MENRIKKLLESISLNDKYDRCVFWGRGIYFVIGNGNLWEISDDASASPKGGWFPDIFTGPTVDEAESLTSLMESLGFDEDFFRDFIDDFGEFDEESVEEYFEDNDDEDSLKTYRKIKRKITGGKTPFNSMTAFANALSRYGLDHDSLYYELDHDSLYYEWDGEYIDLHDNIAETGEERGAFDNMSDNEWVELLENIDNYIVKADTPNQ